MTYLLYGGHLCPPRLSTDLEVRRTVRSFLPLDPYHQLIPLNRSISSPCS